MFFHCGTKVLGSCFPKDLKGTLPLAPTVASSYSRAEAQQIIEPIREALTEFTSISPGVQMLTVHCTSSATRALFKLGHSLTCILMSMW